MLGAGAGPSSQYVGVYSHLLFSDVGIGAVRNINIFKSIAYCADGLKRLGSRSKHIKFSLISCIHAVLILSG